LEAAKRQKLHLVHLCSDKGPPFTGFIRVLAFLPSKSRKGILSKLSVRNLRKSPL